MTSPLLLSLPNLSKTTLSALFDSITNGSNSRVNGYTTNERPVTILALDLLFCPAFQHVYPWPDPVPGVCQLLGGPDLHDSFSCSYCLVCRTSPSYCILEPGPDRLQEFCDWARDKSRASCATSLS